MRALIASEDFRKIVLAAPEPKSVQTASKPAAITLTGALKAGAMKIPDAVGSVVLIQSGGGHGSGFLVSSDGYLLTAAHVVGADKYVKIRWSDGLEGVGEVVRTDKRRDAALIKADARGRRPLAMRRASPEQGDAVFTIGAPIDPKLQSTVTRGVVSANRIMDGFSFIQSDVTVDPGNSGGPLLNEKGEVLGFTDKGLRSSEAPTGLNFFVPIDDALRFLSLEPG
jgi:S1-C subfamily serine protease